MMNESTMLMMMKRLVLCFLLLTISSSHRIVVSAAPCPPDGDCGPFGKCAHLSGPCEDPDNCEKHCICSPGYFGDDCSESVESCPAEPGPDSEKVCLNGGTCYEVQEWHGDAYMTFYRCDCRTAVGEASAYAGHRCEYPSGTSCEIGVDHSSYAFCVNGGKCVQMIQPGEAFLGCDCGGDDGTSYEGRHCQFTKGSAPAQELAYTQKQEEQAAAAAAAEPSRLSGWAIFGIVMASLIVTLCLCGLICQCGNSGRRRNEKQQPPPPSVAVEGNPEADEEKQRIV